MSSGFHRLGCNVEGKDTGYRAGALPVGVFVAGTVVLAVPRRPIAPSMGATLLEGEILADPVPVSRSATAEARAKGFTGDQCSHCFSMKMRRAGACLVCAECGTTTSCG